MFKRLFPFFVSLLFASTNHQPPTNAHPLRQTSTHWTLFANEQERTNEPAEEGGGGRKGEEEGGRRRRKEKEGGGRRRKEEEGEGRRRKGEEGEGRGRKGEEGEGRERKEKEGEGRRKEEEGGGEVEKEEIWRDNLTRSKNGAGRNFFVFG